MMRAKRSLKMVLFLLMAVVLILMTVNMIGKDVEIKKGEAGIIVGKGASYRILKPGESIRVSPFRERVYRISTGTVVISLLEDEGVRVKTKDNREFLIESQITYSIDNIDKVVSVFGYKDTHNKIRDRIKRLVGDILLKKHSEIERLKEDPAKRIPVMAQLHIELLNNLKEDGVSVGRVNIRYR
jgi:hypothetical protein